MYTSVLLYKSGVYGGQNDIGVFSWCLSLGITQKWTSNMLKAVFLFKLWNEANSRASIPIPHLYSQFTQFGCLKEKFYTLISKV